MICHKNQPTNQLYLDSLHFSRHHLSLSLFYFYYSTFYSLSFSFFFSLLHNPKCWWDEHDYNSIANRSLCVDRGIYFFSRRLLNPGASTVLLDLFIKQYIPTHLFLHPYRFYECIFFSFILLFLPQDKSILLFALENFTLCISKTHSMKTQWYKYPKSKLKTFINPTCLLLCK